MKRLVEKKLLAWKESSRRKPLILRGARQVGKTWLVENILARQFEHFVIVDLETRRDLHRYFEKNLEPCEILKGIEFITGRIIPGKTLLFFDEIQACPRAIMALR
jgi:predicted AAA+ superfamily ATPase